MPVVRTARAVVLEEVERPPVISTFEVGAPPAGGLVVACRYAGICGTDLHLIEGHLDVPTPLVLGHEGLGVVDQLGGEILDATGQVLAPGDTVMWASSIACGRCVPCAVQREPTLCTHRKTYGVNRSTASQHPLAGSWADFITLQPGTTVVKLPPGIDPRAAMSFACAGPTMVHALWERRPVRVGETVVVQGSGPVGLAAAALAQLAGAHVILIGGPPSRLAAARAAGIGHEHVEVVVSGDFAVASDAVLSATGGRGADLAIECTGSPEAIEQGTRLIRRNGSYLVVGQYTDAGATWFNPHQLVYRQLTVFGSWAFTGAHLLEYVRLLPALQDNFALADLVAVAPLDEVHAMLERVRAGAVLKAVLTP